MLLKLILFEVLWAAGNQMQVRAGRIRRKPSEIPEEEEKQDLTSASKECWYFWNMKYHEITKMFDWNRNW